MIMVIAILSFLLIVNAGFALAEAPLIHGAKEPMGPAPMRDAFYCQPLNPYWNVHQASTGYSSGVADDIPLEFLGTMIHAVSLYVGEFYGDWIDPDGVVLNIYNSECLPSLEPVMVLSELSIGAYVDNSWGSLKSIYR